MTANNRAGKRRRQARRLLLAAMSFASGCQSVEQQGILPRPTQSWEKPSESQTPVSVQTVRTVAFTENEDAEEGFGTNVDEPYQLDVGVRADDGDADKQGSRHGTEPLRDAIASHAAEPNADVPPINHDQGVLAFEQSVGLTLESVESMALRSHPAIAEARSRVESTRGQYVQAGLPFNPIFQYQSEEVGNQDSTGLHSVALSQQFVTANKLGIAQQVQVREIEKQQAQMRLVELQVLTRTRAAFAAAIVAQRRVELTRQLVDLAEKSVESVVDLFDAEEVSKVAVLQARVEAEQARITAENAQTQLDANLRSLAAAAGLQSLPAGPLSGDISDNLTDAPWELLLAEITAASPELSRAGSELERAKWSLQLACAQVTPNVTGTLGVGVDTSSDDTFAVIGVSVPLPIRDRNQGNIRSARADIAAASAAIENTRLSLEGRLAEAVGRYRVASQRFERLQQSVIPTSEETFELSLEAFRLGEIDYLQLLTAQRTLFNTRLSILDAAAQAKQAAAEIEGLLVTTQP